MFERPESFVERYEVFGLFFGEHRSFIKRNLNSTAAAFVTCVSASVIDQDVTHYLGGDREEVCAVLPFKSLLAGKFQIGFVDERGRLQGVTGTFVTHLALRDAAQLSVDEWQELYERRPIAFAPIGEQLGDFLRRHVGHTFGNCAANSNTSRVDVAAFVSIRRFQK